MKVNGVGVRARLLARLREGPMPGEAWEGICHSRHSLYTNIWQLRQLGYDIRTEGRMGCGGRYVLKEDEA